MRRSRYGVRGRWRWDAAKQTMVQVSGEHRPLQSTPYVQADIPDYVSPASGKLVSGRKQRREDMKRTGSRPWEGIEQEKREAAKGQAEQERHTDQLADRMANIAWRDAPESVRRQFRGR